MTMIEFKVQGDKMQKATTKKLWKVILASASTTWWFSHWKITFFQSNLLFYILLWCVIEAKAYKKSLLYLFSN